MKKLAFLILLIILQSCNKIENKNNLKTATSNNNEENIENTIISLTKEWNDAHNTKDISKFSNLFNDTLNFYGITKTKKECLKSKLELFENYTVFKQNISSDISVEIVDSLNVTCNFTKSVSSDTKKNTYPSFLKFNKKNLQWLITEENDSITLKNISSKKSTIQRISDENIIKICKTSPNIKYNFDYEYEISFDKKNSIYTVWCFTLASADESDSGSTRTIGRYELNLKAFTLTDITLMENTPLYFDKQIAKEIMKSK